MVSVFLMVLCAAGKQRQPVWLGVGNLGASRSAGLSWQKLPVQSVVTWPCKVNYNVHDAYSEIKRQLLLFKSLGHWVMKPSVGFSPCPSRIDVCPFSFSSPANLQQRLLGFMRPDGASSQQAQQELQRKYHSEYIIWKEQRRIDCGSSSLPACSVPSLQPKPRPTRKPPCRASSTWCTAPTRLWRSGSSPLIISSAKSSQSCQRCVIPTLSLSLSLPLPPPLLQVMDGARQ